MAVVAILGLLAGVAVLRWGDSALRNASAEGLARSVAMTLQLARRQAIAEGTPAAVVFDRADGQVSAVRLVRAAAGGDEPTDAALEVPSGVVFTIPADRWEYDYTGALASPAAGGTVAISDGDWDYTLEVNAVTGRVGLTKTN